jgi:hypothetical protein
MDPTEQQELPNSYHRVEEFRLNAQEMISVVNRELRKTLTTDGTDGNRPPSIRAIGVIRGQNLDYDFTFSGLFTGLNHENRGFSTSFANSGAITGG